MNIGKKLRGKRSNRQLKKYESPRILLFVAIFAVVGVMALIRSFAATNVTSLEPEAGTVTDVAFLGNDPTASGNGFVQFGNLGSSVPLLQVGAEQRVSNDGNFAHWESMIVVDPTNANQLLASSMSHNVPGKVNNPAVWTTSVYTSSDAGASWSARQMSSTDAGDPMVAIGSDGTAYHSILSSGGSQLLAVFRSTDNGQTWSAPVVMPEKIDHPMMIVDRTGGSFNNRVYVGAKETSGSKISVYRSADKGQTFQKTIVGALTNGFVDNLIVFGDGTLLVPVRSANRIITTPQGTYGGSSKDVYVTRSTDGGVTFSPMSKFITINNSATGGGGGQPTWAVGTVDGQERVYMLWSDTNTGNGQMYLQYSEDKGTTWSAKQAITNGVSINGTYSAHLSINSAGVIGLSWFQTTGNGKYDVYFMASSDGGQNFSSAAKLNSQPCLAPTYDPRYPGGDYTFMSVTSDDKFQVLWPDSRDTMYQLYTRRISIGQDVSLFRLPKGKANLLGVSVADSSNDYFHKKNREATGLNNAAEKKK